MVKDIIRLLVVFILLMLIAGCKNDKKPLVNLKYNLDFELIDTSTSLPKDWEKWGTYPIKIDSSIVHSGNYSAKICSSLNENTFGSIVYAIPNKYTGNEIKLEGNIRTNEVTGFAGLLLRLDNGLETLAFENMGFYNVKGTNNWKKYSIKLPFFDDVETIYVGGLIVGEGQAWFDDFKLTIDGENIQHYVEHPVKTNSDQEFNDGSKFNLNNITQSQIDNLHELGKTWGFLKYHHPEIANGKYNWDYELFRILPKIKSESFGEELQNWVASFGKIKKENIEDHYYIDFTPGSGNAIFKNESRYKDMNEEDDGYRLLALFRYWNMIEYFFPYKYITDKNWDEVLCEYIPKILKANDELSYKLTLLELIGEVSDTHANIWQKDSILDAFFGKNIAPLEIKYIENKPVVTKKLKLFHNKSKIDVGSRILYVNQRPVSELTEDKLKYTPASNYITKLRDASRRLLRTNDDFIEITFTNNIGTFTENIRTFSLNQVNFHENNNLSHKSLKTDIGYIYTASLEYNEIHDIMAKFIDKKGIVIDLRCYPSDFIVFSMGQYLMPKPLEFVKYSKPDKNNFGNFIFTDPLKVGKENPDYYKGRIAILIDETTQSQAEYTTMALRIAPNAKVFGSQTAGADGNMSEIYLPGNIRTMISGNGIYYPDGTKTQRVGIVPDVEVKSSIKGVIEGRDEVLEAALKFIDEKIDY